MTDPSFIYDEKDRIDALLEQREPLIEELARACEIACAWFRRRHDIGTPVPNHHNVWLQLGKALRRYYNEQYDERDSDDIDIDDSGVWENSVQDDGPVLG